jgi:type 1 glutamine amidotransferase
MCHPLLLPCLLAVVGAAFAAAPADRIKVLIVDGQNNHSWATTTPMLRKILEGSGRFAVDVATSPAAAPAAPRLPRNATAEQKAAHGGALQKHAAAVAEHKSRTAAQWAAWRPAFARYAVVVSNYNGEAWPEDVRRAFVDFVRNGGGFVSYHAANNAFPEWSEYNAMIGLGGWGGRNEKSGPYLRLRGLLWTKDLTAGPGGGHGPQHEFVVEAREPQHPILRGLPPRWLHTKDELYHGLRGPAENVTVLASAFSEATKEHEPMLMVIPYGKGRVLHTTLGHGVEAVNGLGFQVTFARGTEWAATGRVTLPAPKPGDLVVERAAMRAVK